MPKSGSKRRPSARAEETRRALIEAAKDVLRHEGFSAATARYVAARAGCNPGLVFYHFDSVTGLLLAALDEVGVARRARYDEALAGVRRPGELVELASRILREDLDSGDAKLLVEMIAGSSSTPGLGAQVRARVAPWTEFAAGALAPYLRGSPLGTLVDAGQLAHAVVALYLGLELLAQLDGDRRGAVELFDRARRLAAIADLIADVGPAASGKPKE